jgi:hypothetical protein
LAQGVALPTRGLQFATQSANRGGVRMIVNERFVAAI